MFLLKFENVEIKIGKIKYDLEIKMVKKWNKLMLYRFCVCGMKERFYFLSFLLILGW